MRAETIESDITLFRVITSDAGESNMLELRWQQRFQNFTKAYLQLAEICAQEKLNKFEQAGLVQIFEFTFELGWKVLKDKLNYEGYSMAVPRDVIKQAFQVGYIKDGTTWLDALDKRNLLAHIYNENLAYEAMSLIKDRYFPILSALYLFFNDEIKKTT